MKQHVISVVLILVFATSTSLYAQQKKREFKKDDSVLIEMNDGETYSGEIVTKTEEYIILEMSNGEVKLDNSKVKSISEVDPESSFLFPNPNPYRYFISHSSIPLEKGEGYYNNTWVVMNSANFGITKNLSIGGGFEFTSMFNSEIPPIWFLAPKLGFKIKEKWHTGARVLLFGADDDFLTLISANATYGRTESNITLGAGVVVYQGEGSSPVVNISGMHRVSKSIAFVTENYIIPEAFDTDFMSYMGIQGIRIIGRKNSFDIGAIVTPDLLDSDIPVLPMVSYVRKF